MNNCSNCDKEIMAGKYCSDNCERFDEIREIFLDYAEDVVDLETGDYINRIFEIFTDKTNQSIKIKQKLKFHKDRYNEYNAEIEAESVAGKSRRIHHFWKGYHKGCIDTITGIFLENGDIGVLNTRCLKVNEKNRFGEEKQYSCFDYLFSSHKQIHNPNFTIKQFCRNCKVLFLKLHTHFNEIILFDLVNQEGLD